MSFAPLAGRLAARAAELRPAEGSRDNLAKFMALVMCAVLEMLILLCEMLDARAAADAGLVFGRQANRTSLGMSGKSPSRAGLALVPATARVRVRRVVDHQAKPGQAGITTSKILGSHAISLCGPVSSGLGAFRVVRAPLREPPSENRTFRLGSPHAHFVAIS